MKMIGHSVMILVFFLGFAANTLAGDFTKEDAKELTLKAAKLIEDVGIDAARPKLQDIGGEYCKGEKGELYVSVINWDGVWLAYPPRPAGVGKSVLNVKDPDGKYLVKEMIDVAKNKGEGWVEYRWLNPKTNKIQHKIAFVKRVKGQDMYASAGIYQ